VHRRLRPGGDQVAVDDGALLDVMVAACLAGRREVLGGGTRVAALVEQTRAGQARSGAADRSDPDPGIEEAPRGGGECSAAHIPHVGSGRIKISLAAGSRSPTTAPDAIRMPPIVVVGSGASATVTTSEGTLVKRPD
jgi:hypothetical protein